MMKLRSIAILAALLTACTGIRVDKDLDRIESCLQTEPRTALSEIQRLPQERLKTECQRARYALLLSMALDKNAIDVTDDSLARAALHYYAQHKDLRHRMLAWYSLGVVQKNADDVGSAVISFTEAEALSRQVEDAHYRGLASRGLGDLYIRALDGGTALKWYEASEEAFNEIGETHYAVYSKYNQANCLQTLLNFDRSALVLDTLEQYASAHDAYLYPLILLSQASNELLRKDGQTEKALALLKEGSRLSTDGLRCTDASYFSICYSRLGQKDSSALFRQKAEALIRTPADSARICYLFYLSEKENGNPREADRYLLQSIDIQNRLMNQRQSMTLANSLSSYHQAQKIQTEINAKRERQLWVLSIILGILVIVILLQRVKAHRRTIQARERLLSEKEARIQAEMDRTQEALDELESVRMDNTGLRQSIIQTLIEQMSLLKRLSDTYYGVNAPEKDSTRLFDADSFRKKEDLIREFGKSLEAFRGDDSFFVHLEDLVNREKHGMMNEVREVCYHPGRTRQTMDESDFKTLTLMFAGVPDKTTAFIMGMAYGTVRMRRNRYKEFFRRMEDERAARFLQELESPSILKV